MTYPARLTVCMLLRRLLCAVWLSIGLLAAASAAFADHEREDAKTSTLSWTLDSSHSAITSDTSNFYVRLRIKAANVKMERQPLTLALVFDRSGSMDSEDKIGYVRKAGYLVADNLTPKDHVAMIAFNHEVQTLIPLHPVVNREYLHHRIDELHAEGYTNISGGLMNGVAEVKKRIKEPGLHHVIVLTDGVANRGVWQPDALVDLTARLTRNGVTVTTIGVGTEYNESLLARMAQAGGGRYVYVANPDEIPAAFQRELGALLAIVAQNVKLTINMPAGIEPVQVYGSEEPLNPDKLELLLGDLASGEERVLLVKLRVDSVQQQGASVELTSVLTFDDVERAERIEMQQMVSIQRAAKGSTVAAKPSPVLAYARLVEAVDKISLAVQGMDRKLAAEVQQIRQREFSQLKQVAWDSRDQDFVNKAFMFEHYARELQDLIDRGALHKHSNERAQLQKELHYRRYLMQHHSNHRH